MKKKSCKVSGKLASSLGFSSIEVIVVLVLIGLIAAFAIPQLIAARRLMKFTNIQQQITAELREARQLAISQRRRVTVQYDDTNKIVRTFEAPVPTPLPTPTPSPLPSPVPTPPVVVVFGPDGDARNRIVRLTDGGLSANDIVYNAPFTAPTLGDTSTRTNLATYGSISGVNITFNPRGDVINPTTGDTDTNKALFFYENNSKTTFAISILAPGGRIKIWRYNGTDYE